MTVVVYCPIHRNAEDNEVCYLYFLAYFSPPFLNASNVLAVERQGSIGAEHIYPWRFKDSSAVPVSVISRCCQCIEAFCRPGDHSLNGTSWKSVPLACLCISTTIFQPTQQLHHSHYTMNGHAETNGHANGVQDDARIEEMEYDPLQLEMMKEELIVVDNDDNPIGQDSKKTCEKTSSLNSYTIRAR